MTFTRDWASNKADVAAINANEPVINGNLTASNVFLPENNH
jgi:hypothetical protein